VAVTIPLKVEPTDMHWLADEHETELSALLSAPLTFGIGTGAHDEPSQISANGAPSVTLEAEPTATQLAWEIHETPLNVLLRAPGGSGVVSIDQTRPFQASANANVVEASL
jgi:hypothetical protein